MFFGSCYRYSGASPLAEGKRHHPLPAPTSSFVSFHVWRLEQQSWASRALCLFTFQPILISRLGNFVLDHNTQTCAPDNSPPSETCDCTAEGPDSFCQGTDCVCKDGFALDGTGYCAPCMFASMALTRKSHTFSLLFQKSLTFGISLPRSTNHNSFMTLHPALSPHQSARRHAPTPTQCASGRTPAALK